MPVRRTEPDHRSVSCPSTEEAASKRHIPHHLVSAEAEPAATVIDRIVGDERAESGVVEAPMVSVVVAKLET